ncbi:phospholipase D-like domain-containing protein [Rhodobacter ferrooxidans]|uniref:Phospholipase D n=1 Tax=Rhodobacter ferrooxidans TaxID=371731 RepID=C8S406_9RHOB|nr:phospholipase D-like domain-containing protein [Rhodobacter sp. SW2]EEW24268.1 phospholipase D/Transphosphatidylase [Rhodobacter sp. SW2]
MALSELYANTGATGFTINFFMNAGPHPRSSYLAAPFFTTNDPIKALTDKGAEVRLIIRFSPITTPQALRLAFGNPRVKVRYFTDSKFHTKLYIIDDIALVGSANLTHDGLQANRELSVLLRQDRDEAFNALRGLFDELWNDADVLNEEVLREYEKAFKSKGKPQDESAFEKFIHTFVKPAAPKSIVVGSEKKSKERTFIQEFRRKYDEILVPAHHEILEVAQQHGFGRPEYAGQDPQIEMGRFLGWLRLTQGSGDGWRETSLLSDPKNRAKRIAEYVQIWQSTDNTVKGDMYHASAEIENIANIRTYLCDPNELAHLSFNDLFRYLAGCHAFFERLRFVSKNIGADLSGLERLRIDFQTKNTLDAVVRTVRYLLSGTGDAIERAYDCVYGSYKLYGFGEACVMELLGWGEPKRPPFNNRSIRGIRLLGFDVEHLVAGE